MKKFRIAIAGLIHETNTFAPDPTTYADFDTHGSSPAILRGSDIISAFEGGGSSSSGIIKALQRDDVEIIPIMWCAAQPGGIVLRVVYDRLLGEIISDLNTSQPFDAIVLDLHGAMVVEGIEDAEADIFKQIRLSMGRQPFLSAVLDFHGNISTDLVNESDLLIAYRTYPHIDMEDAGFRVAQATVDYLQRQVKPAKAFVQIPYLIPIHAQCTMIQPMSELLDTLVAADEAHEAIVSLLPGFPPADIYDCGPSILAYADNQDRADAALDQVKQAVMQAEPEFAGIGLREGTDAVRFASLLAEQTRQPVIIVDTQDNPGAGASSDTMGLVEELLAQNVHDAVVGVINDPAAAEAAHKAGLGSTITLSLGGKGSLLGIRPLQAQFTIEALGNGLFIGSGAYYNNAQVNFGAMALLRIVNSGVRVIVGSRRAQAGTQAIFYHLNLDPNKIEILGLKSSVHFLADFAKLTQNIIYGRFPGLNTADPKELPYRNIRSSVAKNPSALRSL